MLVESHMNISRLNEFLVPKHWRQGDSIVRAVDSSKKWLNKIFFRCSQARWRERVHAENEKIEQRMDESSRG